MQIRPAEADRYLRNPKHGAILLFGPDTGLVRERASRLAKSVEGDDPFAAVRLDADELAQDPARLIDEATTMPMFGGRRLVEVRGSTQRNLARAFEPLLSRPVEALVVVEAGDLKPTAALRKIFEKSDHGAAVACYPDEGRSLSQVVDEAMREQGLAIDPEARTLLLDALGADRMNTRSELEKLALYTKPDETVTVEHVEAVVTQARPASTDAWVDHVLCGRASDAARELVRLEEEGVSPVAAALALQRSLQTLHRIRVEMDRNGTDGDAVIARLRPPVPFRRRASVRQAVARWREEPLRQALARVSRLNHEVRARAELGSELLGTAALALIAGGGRRR